VVKEKKIQEKKTKDRQKRKAKLDSRQKKISEQKDRARLRRVRNKI
jgi:hypothetical protein